MSINTISSSLTGKLIRALSSDLLKKTNSTHGSNLEPSASSQQISKMGEAMKYLEALAESDPTKFKEVTAQVGQQLQELASTLSGDEAKRVAEMASNFTKAAESGDASQVRPSNPPPKGPPPQGAPAYEKAQSLGSEGSNVRNQIDSILSAALSSLMSG